MKNYQVTYTIDIDSCNEYAIFGMKTNEKWNCIAQGKL